MTQTQTSRTPSSDISIAEVDQAMSTIGVQPDLGMQVVVQIAPGFIKLKNIALICMSKDVDEAARYEVRRLINSHIPAIINSFTSLPIEYRNNKIIKDQKPARGIFLQDLQKILQTIDDLEQKVLSKEEKEFLISHNFFNSSTKTSSNLIGIQQDNPNQNSHLINSNFDYQQWVESGGKDYIVAHANKEQAQEIKSAQNALFTAQRMHTIGHIAKKSAHAAFEVAKPVAEFLKLTASNIIATAKKKYKNTYIYWPDVMAAAGMIAICGLLVGLAVYLATPRQKDIEFKQANIALAYVSQAFETANVGEQMDRERAGKLAQDFLNQTKGTKELAQVQASVGENSIILSLSGLGSNDCNKLANRAMDYFSFQDTRTQVNVNQKEYENKRVTALTDYKPYSGLDYHIAGSNKTISKTLKQWNDAVKNDSPPVSISDLATLNLVLPKNFSGQAHNVSVACGLDKNSLTIEFFPGQKAVPTRDMTLSFNAIDRLDKQFDKLDKEFDRPEKKESSALKMLVGKR